MRKKIGGNGECLIFIYSSNEGNEDRWIIRLNLIFNECFSSELQKTVEIQTKNHDEKI